MRTGSFDTSFFCVKGALKRVLCLIIIFLLLGAAGCETSKAGTKEAETGRKRTEEQSGQTGSTTESGNQTESGGVAKDVSAAEAGSETGSTGDTADSEDAQQSTSVVKPNGDEGDTVTTGMGSGGDASDHEEASAMRVDEMLGTNYKVVKVTKGIIQRMVSYHGVFTYRHPMPLHFGYDGGVLDKVYVQIAHSVKKGDLIAEIKTDSIKEKIEQQRIVLRRTEIVLAQTEEMGRSEIEAALERLSGLKKKYTEAAAMSEVFSKQEVEELEFQITEAEINLNKAEQMYGSGGSGLKGYELVKAGLDVSQAEEMLKQLEAQLEACKIVAPISGVVTWVNPDLRSGTMLSAFDVVVTVADLEDVIFTFREDAKKAENILEIGMKGLVSRDAAGVFSTEGYEGRIVSFENPDPWTVVFDRNAMIDIAVFVDAPRGVFKNNSPANINIILEEARDTVVIPVGAVNSFGGRTYVYVLNNGMREERDVEVGIRTNVDIQITEGLREGEEILLR